MTLCTIAIPVYNRASMAQKALESALAQNCEGLEILVVDDGSTDGAWEALQQYQDSRLRLIRNPSNRGLFGNFNRCLDLAQGKYLRILCTDDRLTSDSLSQEIEIMERHPEVVLLSTQARQIDEHYQPQKVFANHFPPGIYVGKELIGHILWVLSHYCYNPLNYPSGILLRREAALQAGYFDSTFRLVGDLDYWMRVLTLGDAIIADQIGCEIMFHASQEGEAVMADGQYMEEWFALAQRWASYLDRQGIQKRVMEQIGACSLWAASYFLRRKRRDVAHAYWRTATTKGISPLALTFAAVRFIWIQLLLKKRNIRFQPVISRRVIA